MPGVNFSSKQSLHAPTLQTKQYSGTHPAFMTKNATSPLGGCMLAADETSLSSRYCDNYKVYDKTFNLEWLQI